MTKPTGTQPADIPWAAYARYSDRKQDRSVEQQIAEFRAYAAANGLALPDACLFADEARSGKSDVSRDGLLRLMEFLERRPRPAAGVLLWSSSRLARNMDDADWYKAAIRRGGYELIYVGEPLLNSIKGLEGRLMEDLTEYRDAKFREDLARDVVRGMYDELAAGRPVFRVPRGYRIDQVDGQRRMLIDPRFEAAVRLAWEMRAAGHSIMDIHEQVDLYRTRQAYSGMFRNRAYLGLVAWRGREYPDFCPPLITPAQWTAVQAVGATHVHPRRARSTFLLSGLTWCECGRPMFGQHNHGRAGASYGYYRCCWDLTKGMCNHIRSDALEAHVIGRAQAEFTPKALGPTYRAWMRRRGTQMDRATRARDALKLKLQTASRAIDNLLGAIEAGGQQAPRSLVSQLAAREAERDKVRDELLALLPPSAETPFNMEAYCARIQAQLASDDLATRRLVLRAIVEKITVAHSRAVADVVIVFRRLPA
jgi:DNA invertase Pin-like site-specific DNA recombinase